MSHVSIVEKLRYGFSGIATIIKSKMNQFVKPVEKSEKPCRNHRLAFGSPTMPEAKNYKLKRCRKCKWWIRD